MSKQQPRSKNKLTFSFACRHLLCAQQNKAYIWAHMRPIVTKYTPVYYVLKARQLQQLGYLSVMVVSIYMLWQKHNPHLE